MSKFCTICGTVTVDGSCPNGCEEVKREVAVSSVADSTPSVSVNIDLNNIVNTCLNLFINMLKAPVTTMTTAVKQDTFVPAIIFLVLQAIITGIMLITGLKQVYSSIGSLMGMALGTSSSSMGSFLGSMDIPYGTIFTKTATLVLVQSLGLIVGIYVIGGLVMQGNKSFKNAVKVVGLAQVPIMALTVVALILAFIKITIGLAILLFASLVGMVLYYQGAKDYLGVSENKIVYLIPGAYIVMFLGTYIYLTIFQF